jgi:hypothetical protein
MFRDTSRLNRARDMLHSTPERLILQGLRAIDGDPVAMA